jgi:hypothetical protein
MVKCFFPYAHVSKTQKFNCKMYVLPINLEVNMGMNVNIHPHDVFHSSNVWMKNFIYMFLLNKTSIKMMDECFILSLISFYGQFFFIILIN